jgi:hypothetical protein
VQAKPASRAAWAARRPADRAGEAKMGSGRKRRLTVHLLKRERERERGETGV